MNSRLIYPNFIKDEKRRLDILKWVLQRLEGSWPRF